MRTPAYYRAEQKLRLIDARLVRLGIACQIAATRRVTRTNMSRILRIRETREHPNLIGIAERTVRSLQAQRQSHWICSSKWKKEAIVSHNSVQPQSASGSTHADSLMRPAVPKQS